MTTLFREVAAEAGAIDHIIAFDCVLNRIDAERRQVAREVSGALFGQQGDRTQHLR